MGRFRSDQPRGNHFLHDWRKHHNYTLEQLAEAIGIDQSSLSRIERGEQPYSEDLLVKLAAIMLAPPAALIGWEPGVTTEIVKVLGEMSEANRLLILPMLRTMLTITSKPEPD